MAPGVTKKDLSDLDLKISKEQTELRHEDRRKMQVVLTSVDDVKDELNKTNKETALLQQSIGTMNSELKEIKTVLDKIWVKLEDLPGKFVAKDEYKETISRLYTELEKEKEKTYGINVKIATFSGIFTTIIFFVEKVWK